MAHSLAVGFQMMLAAGPGFLRCALNDVSRPRSTPPSSPSFLLARRRSLYIFPLVSRSPRWSSQTILPRSLVSRPKRSFGVRRDCSGLSPELEDPEYSRADLSIGTTATGINFVLYTASLVLLLRRARSCGLNVPILLLGCALFASCTAHFALEFSHFFVTLVRIPHAARGNVRPSVLQS